MTARNVAILTGIALLWHALWALTIPVPEDWDAQYYALVARHLVDGRGAVTDGLWNLSYLPEKLPAPATHWMPLASWVLVPGLWLWDRGDQATTVLLSACWAPLAWAIARRSGLPDRECLVAGLFAGVVHGYTRLGSTPDTYAIYGVLGGVATLAIAGNDEDRSPIGDLFAFFASLTRNDGPLLGLSLALTGRWRDRPAMALSALVPAGLWTLNRYIHLGPGYLEARRLVFSTGSYLDFYDGLDRDPLTAWGRVEFLGTSLPTLAEAWVLPGVGVLTVPAVVGAVVLWDRGWTRSLAVFFAFAPLVAILMAPAIASHGTLPRMLAAALPAHAVWAAAGLSRIAAWGQEKRGYPRVFVWGSAVAGAFVVSLALGPMRARDGGLSMTCPDIPVPGPVFTSQPLTYELVCHRPGVMITRTLPPERAAMIARRYGIKAAIYYDDEDEGSLRREDLSTVLPRWTDRGPWAAAP